MKLLGSSSVALLNLDENDMQEARSFQYNWNKKRAKAKLLKGAK